MIEFIGFIILICFIGVVALITNAIIVTCRRNALPSEFSNQQMFIDSDPIVSDVPKRPIADSNWFVKTFMRPRRKKV
ncbi:hypothetical protein [Lysinibacillus sp. NPDC093216]|uniref:hypothetical protein n=1 Tax=Lysinibacillus sp. NPDC093216 TaxID=3390576 RepID=UPI003CFC9816